MTSQHQLRMSCQTHRRRVSFIPGGGACKFSRLVMTEIISLVIHSSVILVRTLRGSG